MFSNTILLVYSDPLKNEAISRFLSDNGISALAVSSHEEAAEMLRHKFIDVIITDEPFARNPGDEIYQMLKLLNPMVLILRMELDSRLENKTNKLTRQAMDYIGKILRILGTGFETNGYSVN